MRIATYHRVSTVDQNADAARSELRAFAERLGGSVALEVEETGSGARNDRPGLLRVMEAARKREIDCVVVWKLDRLGRSTLDLHTNAANLEAYGCRFACVTQNIDTATPHGKLLFTVLAAVSEFERDTIRERTHLGLKRARSKGMRLGRPPVKTGHAAKVLELHGQGESIAKIAKATGESMWSVRKTIDILKKQEASNGTAT